MGDTTGQSRRAELATNLESVTDRLSAALVAAGRAPDAAKLLVVTKYFPASDVVTLADLGCTEFGESREPEASRKVADVRDATADALSFDMIGRVQRKKAGSVARWARTVHSVDTAPLVDALARAALTATETGARTAPLGALVQVSLDGDPQRGGVLIDDVAQLSEQIAAADALELRGLMAIAPTDGERERWMTLLAKVHGEHLRRFPEATELSAGMSSDLEVAVRFGSTCVRVGTAILGERPIP